MIDNITIDTGNGIATFSLGGNIVFTSRFNGKRYETIIIIYYFNLRAPITWAIIN